MTMRINDNVFALIIKDVRPNCSLSRDGILVGDLSPRGKDGEEVSPASFRGDSRGEKIQRQDRYGSYSPTRNSMLPSLGWPLSVVVPS